MGGQVKSAVLLMWTKTSISTAKCQNQQGTYILTGLWQRDVYIVAEKKNQLTAKKNDTAGFMMRGVEGCHFFPNVWTPTNRLVWRVSYGSDDTRLRVQFITAHDFSYTRLQSYEKCESPSVLALQRQTAVSSL